MKKQSLKIICIILLMIICTSCNQSYDNKIKSNTNSNGLLNNDTKKEINSIVLSNYTYEVEFIDKDEIKEIADNYNLDNVNSIIKIIYVPTLDEIEDDFTYEGSYSINQLDSYDENIDLIYSSQFNAPGGVAKIKREIQNKNRFSSKCDNNDLENALKANYKTEIGESYTLNKEYNIDVSEGKTGNVEAYEIDKVYSYELIQKDDTLGTGKLNRAVGMMVVISE